MSKTRFIGIAAAALAATSAVPALAASHPAPVRLPGVVPGWVTNAHVLGIVDPAQMISLKVVLNYRDSAGLANVVRSVSDPASPRFRQFLTTSQFNDRFAPSEASVAAVTSWLSSTGLRVDRVTNSRVVVVAHGTAAVVQKALGTTLRVFSLAGQPVRAPISPATIPAQLRAIVGGIAGLDSVRYVPKSHVDANPPLAFLNARPCSAYWDEKVASDQPAFKGKHLFVNPCGYTPEQVRGAYGLDKIKQTGAGATVAIIDAYASSTIEHDLATYSQKHGLPQMKSGQFTQKLPSPIVENTPELASNVAYAAATGVVYTATGPVPVSVVSPPSFDPEGWSGEETLDVEAVHTMAPGANIVYVPALSDNNDVMDLAMLETLENTSAQVVSNSYGISGEFTGVDDKLLFDQAMSMAASKGISVVFSSGDSGDEVENTGKRTADYPASSDLVTALGATSLYVGKTNNYLGEGYWGTRKYKRKGAGWDTKSTFSGGGGGGVSSVYAEPSYQKGVVPDKLATYGGVAAGRVLPDISIVGDSTTGFLVGQTQIQVGGQASYSEFRIGGTSVSAPLFAAILADAIEAGNGAAVGFVNPMLYAHANSNAYRDVVAPKDPVAVVRYDYTDFSDPASKVVASVRSLGNLSTLHLTKGFDDATGLGTPYAPTFVAMLALRARAL